jgi:hypothetical protein
MTVQRLSGLGHIRYLSSAFCDLGYIYLIMSSDMFCYYFVLDNPAAANRQSIFCSTKETSEKIKVRLDHLFTAGAIFYIFVLIPVSLLQAKNKLTMLQARSSTFMVFTSYLQLLATIYDIKCTLLLARISTRCI